MHWAFPLCCCNSNSNLNLSHFHWFFDKISAIQTQCARNIFLHSQTTWDSYGKRMLHALYRSESWHISQSISQRLNRFPLNCNPMNENSRNVWLVHWICSWKKESGLNEKKLHKVTSILTQEEQKEKSKSMQPLSTLILHLNRQRNNSEKNDSIEKHQEINPKCTFYVAQAIVFACATRCVSSRTEFENEFPAYDNRTLLYTIYKL